MKGYSWHEVFSEEARNAYEFATRMVEAVSVTRSGVNGTIAVAVGSRREVRCHEIARAVFAVLTRSIIPAKACVVDGRFDHVDHSWIALDEDTILDTYCVGRVPMVQLVNVAHPLGCIGRLYVVSPFTRTDIDLDCVTRLCSVMADAINFNGGHQI